MSPSLFEETFVRFGEIYELRMGGQVIQVTPEHPLYVEGKGWTPAGEVVAGDCLSTIGLATPFARTDVGALSCISLASGLLESSGAATALAKSTGDSEWMIVESIESTGRYHAVYNFRVADWHTYFVGTPDWKFALWAHNAGNAYRALRPEDLASLQAGQRIMPKSNSGTIIDHIRGDATKYISLSQSESGIAKYLSGSGWIEVDLNQLLKTGSGIVPFEQVLQVARRQGSTLDVKNVIRANEILVTGGIDPSAAVRISGL